MSLPDKDKIRYSKEFFEITESKIGILEGSKFIADVRNSLKPEDECHAIGERLVACYKAMDGIEDPIKFMHNIRKNENISG